VWGPCPGSLRWPEIVRAIHSTEQNKGLASVANFDNLLQCVLRLCLEPPGFGKQPETRPRHV